MAWMETSLWRAGWSLESIGKGEGEGREEESVDCNTEQVTNMAQFHNFVFLRLSQVSFQFDPRCRSMFAVSLLTTVCKTHPYSFLQLFNLLVVARIFKDHVNCIHVSGAQNPLYRLKVNEFTVLSTSQFSLLEF